MANSLISVLRKPLALNLALKLNQIGLASIYTNDVRFIYSKSSLGLDGFELSRERILNQMANIQDKFREKMSEYVVSESKNMIFTEDLKNMVHLAKDDSDITLTVEMLKRYNKQNKSLRFGNYIFGPVVMRMFYIHNKADQAFECFKSEEFSGIFDQYITFQLLMDLLYENGKYNEVLEAFNIIVERQVDGQKYPKNCVVLVIAACFKLNTPASLDFALNLWSKLQETGHQPMRRATTFCAGLALNQSKPDIALEILGAARNQSYTTVRNIRVACLAEIGRLHDIIPVLKSVLSEDNPTNNQAHTFNRDVLDKVKKAMANSDNPEITVEFNRLEQILEKQGHVVENTLAEQLCSEIQRPPKQQQGYQDYQDRFQSRSRRPNRMQRPGLKELV